MGTIISPQVGRRYLTALVNTGMVPTVIMDINALSTGYVHALVAYDNVAHVDVTSPDKARIASATIKNINVGPQNLDADVCTITGVTWEDVIDTENIIIPATAGVLSGASVTVYGNKAWKIITQIQFAGPQTNPAWWEMSAGIGDKLAVMNYGESLYGVCRNNANDDVANYTLDTTYHTISPIVAWIAGEDLTLYLW